MLAVEGNIPIGVTIEPGLTLVAMKVRDVTSGHPGTPIGTFPMIEGEPGSYSADFPGVADKNYTVKKAVYTSGSYATIDSDYPTGDEVVQVIAKAAKPVLVPPTILAKATLNVKVKAIVTSVVILKPC